MGGGGKGGYEGRKYLRALKWGGGGYERRKYLRALKWRGRGVSRSHFPAEFFSKSQSQLLEIPLYRMKI